MLEHQWVRLPQGVQENRREPGKKKRVPMSEGHQSRQPRLAPPNGGDQNQRNLGNLDLSEETRDEGKQWESVIPGPGPGLSEHVCDGGVRIQKPTEVLRQMRVPAGDKQIQAEGAAMPLKMGEKIQIQPPVAGVPPMPGIPVCSKIGLSREVFCHQGNIPVETELENVFSEVGQQA